jgi:putative flippase GtrA
MRVRANPRILRFISVGTLNFIFGYSVYGILVIVGLDYKVSLLAATIIGVCFNYFTNKTIVFKSEKKVLPLFVVVYITQYFSGILLIEIFILYIDNKLIAGFFVAIFIALVSYIPLSKIFHEKK